MESKYIKKTILINQEFIDKAVKLFNVKTEKDAVNRALEIVTEENDIIIMHKEIGGVGDIQRAFK